MAKPELGLKRICVSCGARFYDLGRSPAVCPKCGAEQPTDLPRPKRAEDVSSDELKRKVSDENNEDIDVNLDTDEDEDDVIEDTSDLDDDDDDLGAEIEVNTDSDDHEN